MDAQLKSDIQLLSNCCLTLARWTSAQLTWREKLRCHTRPKMGMRRQSGSCFPPKLNRRAEITVVVLLSHTRSHTGMRKSLNFCSRLVESMLTQKTLKGGPSYHTRPKMG